MSSLSRGKEATNRVRGGGTRYGAPVYEQVEDNFEEAIRVVRAYIDWQLDNHTDAQYTRTPVGRRSNVTLELL